MAGERAAAALAAALLLASCGGGSGGTASPAAPSASFLGEADVRRVIAQAAGEAQARGAAGHIAVVDRVGNLLGTFEMTGAPASLTISSGMGVAGGLDGLTLANAAAFSAVAKAITGAYLSSNGNAFSTRTAGQIIREHFDPQEAGQPSGPLYGVQYSQLPCSDINRYFNEASLGPKRSPFGLAADPGGLPLYKDGILVGGIGVEIDGRYSLDRDLADIDQDVEELVAVAGSAGFAAPADVRADRITADGRTFRFVDSQALMSDPARAPAFEALPGRLEIVPGFSAGALRAGAAYGTSASGVRPAGGVYAGGGAWILVDASDANRYPASDSLDGALRAPEVEALLADALAVARRARAQIRRPLGSTAEVSIAVVDKSGRVLGLVRTADGPIFGIDVAVQKARTAMQFSHPQAAQWLGGLVPAREPGPVDVALGKYVDDARAFLGDPLAFTGSTAWSARAIGNLHRPFFPDGIDGTAPGPFSTPFARWSPFNPGLQLDLIFNNLLVNVPATPGCASGPTLQNGMQVFPGGIPIYRGAELVGAIGVSGDGVDQDDMTAFLGLANAGKRLATGIGNAPREMRADRLTPRGVRLRYVQCPQAPFVDSSQENVCAGL
jgi:uncharacterized protein GlcG (DUF336 family)